MTQPMPQRATPPRTTRTDRPRSIALIAMAALTLALCWPARATDRFYIGPIGGYWNTAANWSPAGVPGGVDRAILDADVVNLAAPTAGVDGLFLSSGSVLDNRGHRILVDDEQELAHTQVGADGEPCLLIVSPTSGVNDMDTDRLFVISGTLLMTGGAIVDTDSPSSTYPDGTIDGDGDLVVNGRFDHWGAAIASDGDFFSSQGGVLRVTGPGLFTFQGPAASLIATENGSSLWVETAEYSGLLGGTVTVGPGCSVHVPWLNVTASPWRGLIDLDGGTLDCTAPIGLLLGGDMIVAGTSTVAAAVWHIRPGASVSLAESSTVLTADCGLVSFSSATHALGPGKLEITRDLELLSGANIQVGALDIDGPGPLGTGIDVAITETSLEAVNVQADRISDGSTPGRFRGRMVVHGARLSLLVGSHDFVLTDGGDSQFEATLELVDSGAGIPHYAGSDLVVGPGATLQVTDDTGGTAHPQGYIFARTEFVSGTVRITGTGNNPWLALADFSIFDGGTVFQSGGTLKLVDNGGGSNVRADQAIGCEVWIGTQNPVRLDTNVTLELTGGAEFWGGPIESTFGPSTGTALILDGDSVVVHDTTISVDRFDWSGAVRGDIMTVTSGRTLTIDSPVLNDLFNEYADQLVVSDGAAVHVNTDDLWRLRTYSGGGQATIRLAGPDAVVDGQLLDVRFGNIVGNGEMRCAVINEGDIIPTDDAFDNQGTDTLSFGTSFQQRPGGRFHVDVKGPDQGEFDRIVVNGPATLGGLIRFMLRGVYVPAVGTEFTVVEASSVIGTFDALETNLPAGLAWSLSYEPDRVRATVVAAGVPGDITGDGLVDVADLLALLTAWGPCADPCPPACAGDFDADCTVGVSDLLVVLGNWD